jgi:DNA-binding NarL/FixJ family response regulator
LIADDHVKLRADLARLLASEFTVAAAVGDGHTALEATALFRPEVVVLDLSMPIMSGLEAATRLRGLRHPPGIVVLTTHNDPSLVSAAYKAGASEFVLKTRMSVELIPAIQRALNGLASASGQVHAVYFYEDEESLSRMVARFVGEGLDTGDAAILIATPSHSRSILAQLTSMDPQQRIRQGDLVVLDASELLSRLMVDGMASGRLFEETLRPIIDQVGRGGSRVVKAYGEMVDLLWRRRAHATALSLETLWNELATTCSFSLLCGYSMDAVGRGKDFGKICDQHTGVLPV